MFVAMPLSFKVLRLLPFVLCLVPLFHGCMREKSAEELRADSLLAAIRTEPQLASARALLREAITLDSELDRSAQVAEEAEQLANNYLATAELDSAVHFFDLAYEYYYKKAANRIASRRVRFAMASLLQTLGEEQDAYEIYAEMLRIARVVGDKDALAEVQWAMLPACRILKRYDEETGLLTELLNSSTDKHDTRMQARVYRAW